MFLNGSVVVSVNLRVFEGGQPAPDICLSEMRQIITTALRTVFGEVRFICFLNISLSVIRYF